MPLLPPFGERARHKSNKTTMSESESPAAATGGEPASPNPAQTPNKAQTSTFGTSRGSGLARGKRPVHADAPAAGSAAAPDYTPTAISVVTAGSEYKNPFAPETPAPAAAAAPESATPQLAAAEPAAVPAPSPVAIEPAPAEIPATPARPAAKPALDILPPAESKRAAQSWESDSFRRSGEGQPRPRRDERAGGERDRSAERPVFRPEKRENRPAPEQSNRLAQVQTSPAEKPKKSGGFFSWLKNLFGGKSAAPETNGAAGERDDHRERPHYGEGQDQHSHHRRRHRGGRGRYNNNRGGQPGDEQRSGGEYRSSGGEPHGERPHYDNGGGRRRRRGGRGRYRSGGDQSRPENNGPENT